MKRENSNIENIEEEIGEKELHYILNVLPLMVKKDTRKDLDDLREALDKNGDGYVTMDDFTTADGSELWDSIRRHFDYDKV